MRTKMEARENDHGARADAFPLKEFCVLLG